MLWALLIIFNTIVLFCVLKLFLYLSVGQRGQENWWLQIYRVKHTASWYSVFGIIHHDFFLEAQDHGSRNDHLVTSIAPTQEMPVHFSPSLSLVPVLWEKELQSPFYLGFEPGMDTFSCFRIFVCLTRGRVRKSSVLAFFTVPFLLNLL